MWAGVWGTPSGPRGQTHGAQRSRGAVPAVLPDGGTDNESEGRPGEGTAGRGGQGS